MNPGFTRGNRKLGPNVWTWSRPYGDTCPKDCKHLIDDDCWGRPSKWNMDKLYEGAMRRLDYVPPISSLPRASILRLHAVGDFANWREGLAVDTDYLTSVVSELVMLYAIDPSSKVFGYTHMWAEPALWQIREWMNLHASVETIEDMYTALRDGWTVAFTSPDVSLDEGFMKLGDEMLLVCPEQRGTVDNCEECGFCWNMPSIWAGVAFKEKQ
jgi:hypothetical protein